MFNLFFDGKFDASVNELGIPTFSQFFPTEELNKFRKSGKGGPLASGGPREAAVRAFHNIVLLNKKIPIEQRLESGFKGIFLIKAWRFSNDVNIDLYLAARAAIDESVREYVGTEYENNFYEALIKMGVLVPITHDHLSVFAQISLVVGKRDGFPPDIAAVTFYANRIANEKEKYRAYLSHV